MAFARAVKTTRHVTRLTLRGDVAWIVSSSDARGERQGRPVASAGAELMVFVRTPAGMADLGDPLVVAAPHVLSLSRDRGARECTAKT